MKLTSKGYDILRNELFGRKLSEAQVQALEFLVGKFDEAKVSYPEAAYMLATVYHETGIPSRGGILRTMQPVKEAGSKAYLEGKKYFPYIGYGYVQLTWKANYERVGKLIGVDLIADPSKALEPEIAAKIMIVGMKAGWFTGVGFDRKCPVAKYDLDSYVRARKIINGTDKALTIGNYAMIFERALRSD